MGEIKVDCRTIQEWANGFEHLYKNPDSSRSPEDFWNAAMAHISVIGENIRRINYRELVESAAHAFCWMTCFIKKCNNSRDELFHFENNLSQIVGLKYPKVCGHCTQKHCACNPVEMDRKKDKAAKYTELFEEWKNIKFEIYSLNDWLYDFWNIYSGQIHLLTIESIGFHLLEEAGEEAKAVRQLIQFRGIKSANIAGIDQKIFNQMSNISGLVKAYASAMTELKSHYKTDSEKDALNKIDYADKSPVVLIARLVKGKMDFIIELADTFSWFCAVLLKLQKVIENEDLPAKIIKSFHLEEELKRIYKSENKSVQLACYACKKIACECVFFPNQ